MKKFYLFGMTALLCASLFVLGCDDGGGGGGGGGIVPVKFKFSDGGSSSSLNIIASRSVTDTGISRSETPGADSFTPYTEVYTVLGDKIESITPTTLKFAIKRLVLVGNAGNDVVSLVDGESPDGVPEVTFTPTVPVTIRLSDIESGHYDMIGFAFETEEMRYGPKPPKGEPDDRPKTWSEITFAWPGGMSESDRGTWLTAMRSKTTGGAQKVKSQGGSLTIIPRLLEVDQYDTAPKGTCQLSSIIFAGNIRKMTQGYYYDELVPGYPHIEEQGDPVKVMLIVPFPGGVTIPDGANAVRFEISWDLDGLVEHYKGTDGTANNSDDIFVLKNRWWDGFNIKAVIE
jgi:hypothetical protein